MENSVVETQVSQAAVASAIDKLAFLENATPSISITSTYLEFNEGQEERLVYLGMTKINVKDQASGELREIDAVQFLGKGKKMYVNGSVNLVNQIKSAKFTSGTMLQVTMTGKDKNVKLFDVTILDPTTETAEATVVDGKGGKK